MEVKDFTLGRSLPVPCVQEMVKNPIVTIPSRYIRAEQDQPVVSEDDFLLEIPVIDMHRLLDEESVEFELDKLHLACKEWGFFQLVNHGISSSLIQNIKTEIQEFFDLPMEEKKRFWQREGDIEGFGQVFVVSEEQKLDWGDLFSLTTYPIYLRKPHLFPKLPLPFRETLDVYAREMKNLANAILAQIAKALKMDEKEIRELFDDGWQGMRLNYYPPCPQPELAIGLTPHSDAVGLTILLQINEVEGLQIKKDGKWVPVKPLPDAFIINIGDILEIITNGTYRSIEHRATVNSEKERLSIATFCSPTFEGEIGPSPSLITEPQFKRVGMKDYLKGIFARELHEKSYLDMMRI